jgi:hypothetical protein
MASVTMEVRRRPGRESNEPGEPGEPSDRRLGRRYRHLAPAVFGIALVATGVACSEDGGDLADPVASTAPAVTGTTASPATIDDGSAGQVTAGPVASGPVASPASTIAPTTAVPTFTVVEVPEEGVPGLDSPDEFCSSWSRFGGSLQVISVASAFLSADPTEAFAIEVAASPVVTDSFERLLSAWPEELTDEFDTVADTVFGPYAARAADAMEALSAAGATEADLTELSAAWISALAQRDPTTPEVALALPADLQSMVDAAAEDFAVDHPTVFADPALKNEVATPLTDQYLAVSCPDQGSLAGGEVGG